MRRKYNVTFIALNNFLVANHALKLNSENLTDRIKRTDFLLSIFQSTSSNISTW